MAIKMAEGQEAEARYNGWKNRETWNCALWIQNDEPLYRAACSFLRAHRESEAPYAAFIADAGMTARTTPDGVAWISTILDYEALDDMIRDLVAE